MLPEACRLFGEYTSKLFKIPARSRNLFRFHFVFALSLHDECGGKESNGVLKQRDLSLELVVNSFRLRIVAPLKIGYTAEEGCKVEQKLLFIFAFSSELLLLGGNCALQPVDFGGEGGDCAILLLNQEPGDLEFVPKRAELLGLGVVARLEFFYLEFCCQKFRL